MTTDPPTDAGTPADGTPHDIHLADGLSPDQAGQARRIFASLRSTRRTRHEQAEPGTTQRLCSALLADRTPCLLPLPHSEHRELGPPRAEGVSI